MQIADCSYSGESAAKAESQQVQERGHSSCHCTTMAEGLQLLLFS